MAKVRTIDSIQEKWGTVTPQRAPQYRQGVENPLRDWATGAAGAEDRYKRGVTEAANQGRFGKGVKRVGTEGWQAGASRKGPARFSEGVMISKDKYGENTAPFIEEIGRTELPPRGPKGDPNNIQRVAAIAKALHDRKMKMYG